ncbi:YncE family protein [Anaeromyxobacter sp. Fw109-5]|uniref:YncE family protein n=1 Tax=Anaeromyxobacter sp. (strain Fw109-5) TaxID=404589 RepID=UPI0000ED82D6|nr:YncE family protein [Anaeromyxobacter sp. Fw109-5]ABS26034.1 conserved hypothetical protein [Anaeromyxobacter sp. Fw109-5]
MRRPFTLSAALAVLLATTACRPAVRATPPRALRGDQAELAVYVQPLAAGPLVLELATIAATREDGPPVPLELHLGRLSPETATRQRLVASGRLPPGSYTGLAVALRRATLAPNGGTGAALAIPEEPLVALVPFAVASGRGQVLLLSVRPEAVNAGAVLEGSALAAYAPDRPSAPLLGVSAVDYADSLLLFDRRAGGVVALFPTGPEPRTVAIDAFRQRVYVASSGANRIDAFDLATFETLDSTRLRVGDRPLSMALTPSGGLLVVANPGSDTVSLVDPIGGQELERVSVAGEPSWVTLDRPGLRAFVASRRTSTVSIITTDVALLTSGSAAVLGSFSVEPDPIRLFVEPAGDRLIIAYARTPYVTVHALPSGAMADRIFTGAPASALLRDPRSGALVVATADGKLQLYDPGTLLATATIALPAPATYLVIDDAENALLALLPGRGSVAVVDLTARKLRGEFELGPGPHDLALVAERR